MRNTRLMIAASGLATLALLGTAATANAAVKPKVTNGPSYTKFLTGYEINSQVSFNEVRGTVHLPAGSTSSAVVGLQENVNGGATYALGLIYNPSQNGWDLMRTTGHIFNVAAGVPLGPGLTFWHYVATNGTPAGDPLFSSITGGSAYIEVHYSTSTNSIVDVEGPTETNNAALNGHFSFANTFNAPFQEVADFGGYALPVSTPQASFTRNGVTEPAGSNVGGIAGTRVTLDFFPVDLAEATALGGAPSIGNPVVLFPSTALPQTSSDWAVSTGSF